VNVTIGESPIHGLGVFACAEIEVDTEQNFYGLLTDTPTNYGFDFQERWFEPFPPFRYTNHSNEPNCEVSVYPDCTFEIIALRDIAAGEELTIDYGFDPAGDSDGK